MIRKSTLPTEQGATQVAKSTRLSLRARIAAAFRRFANAADERTANDRTRKFYQSSGRAWARFVK